MTFYKYISTSLGKILLLSDGQALTGLYLPKQANLIKIKPCWSEDEHAEIFTTTIQQLNEYLAGNRYSFELPLTPSGTLFQQSVWQALREIPFGQTTSYSEMAMRIGRPFSPRAVGHANGRNPISIIIPCHRLIGKDGSLIGYGGGLDIKEALIEFERSVVHQGARKFILP
jgi:methylated-DNA-[protein]-cysteine S-methyltransferase